MNDNFIRIDDSRLVLKAAQAVWASHKYFVLACSQPDYLQIRRELRPDSLQLEAAFSHLEKVTETFRHLDTEELPQLSNSLFHIAGYFKDKLSHEERQQMNRDIQTNPALALEQLRSYTFYFQIEYLQMASLWPQHRARPFNMVAMDIPHKGRTYGANQLFWQGNHLLLKERA